MFDFEQFKATKHYLIEGHIISLMEEFSKPGKYWIEIPAEDLYICYGIGTKDPLFDDPIRVNVEIIKPGYCRYKNITYLGKQVVNQGVDIRTFIREAEVFTNFLFDKRPLEWFKTLIELGLNPRDKIKNVPTRYYYGSAGTYPFIWASEQKRTDVTELLLTEDPIKGWEKHIDDENIRALLKMKLQFIDEDAIYLKNRKKYRKLSDWYLTFREIPPPH